MWMKLALVTWVAILAWVAYGVIDSLQEQEEQLEICEVRGGKLVRGVGSVYICVKRDAIL